MHAAPGAGQVGSCKAARRARRRRPPGAPAALDNRAPAGTCTLSGSGSAFSLFRGHGSSIGIAVYTTRARVRPKRRRFALLLKFSEAVTRYDRYTGYDRLG